MRFQLRRAVTAFILAGSLGGCSYAPSETRAAYQPVTDPTATAKPLALLPAEGGAVVAVLESRNSGIYTQRIILDGDATTQGENAVIVQIDQSERRTADLSAVPKPTVDGIARELETNFPSTDMRISRARGHNEFGPFEYAVGKAPGQVTCLYAWQFSRGAPLGLVEDPQSHAAAASMPSSPTSIRVRLCRHGQSEAELVSWVRAMEVSAPEGGTPYHDTLYSGSGPTAAGNALQAAAAPSDFYPRETTPGPILKQKSSKARRQIGRQRARPTRDFSNASPSVSPAPAGVVVPLPPGGASSSDSAVNPLLAPLQAAAPPPRAVRPTDDMPLPGPAPAPSLDAPPSPRPGSTMPLPN